MAARILVPGASLSCGECYDWGHGGSRWVAPRRLLAPPPCFLPPPAFPSPLPFSLGALTCPNHLPVGP